MAEGVAVALGAHGQRLFLRCIEASPQRQPATDAVAGKRDALQLHGAVAPRRDWRENNPKETHTMNTCDTCKWWKVAYKGMCCTNPKLSPAVRSDDTFQPSGDELYVYSIITSGATPMSEQDRVKYVMAVPWTEPKFGCIHHEPLTP